jgi:23S rRNA (guanosine2251-2'-O)-methyltransferase
VTDLVLEGHLSIEAALEAVARPVHRIWAVRPGDRRFRRLRALAREAGVTIDEVEPERIDEVASGRSHGGIVAIVGPRRTVSVQQLLAKVGERPLVVMLDGIEDPFNHGQAVRALYAAGADGLVVRRDWESAVATVTRASAGATELMPTATASTAHEAAEACRAVGLRVVVADAGPDAIPLEEADLRGGVFVLIGGERRGVTRSFVDEADVRVRIAYGREGAPALGTASAAAVIGFAALRQRRGERP